MNLKTLMQEIEAAPLGTEKNDYFARKKGAIYFLKHIRQYYTGGRTELRYVAWVLGSDKCNLGQFVMNALPEPKKEALVEDLTEAGNDLEDYANQLSSAIRDTPSAFRHRLKSFIKQSIVKKLETLEYSGKSEIEKNVEIIKKMFNLERHELEMVVFFFIMASFDVPERLFDINLGCDRFAGRKYLDNILGLTTTQTGRTISKLEQMGIIFNGTHSISLDDDIITLLQNPHSEQLSKQFFRPVKPCNIPLNFHFVAPDVLSFLKQLVRIKSESSSNILFYGPPGTGKSTMANTLANSARMPVYEITRDERNRSENCRTAILACMNMTNTGKGSVIIVDEADNLLNTMNSWFLRGETQDKGWLNNLLEKPGTRMIWITNRIDGIEDSVLRRFAYVLEFKPFSTQQRTILFERILRTNRAKRFYSKSDIVSFAKKYRITAGSFDLAVKKAKDTGAKNKIDFQKTVCLCLDANLACREKNNKATLNSCNENLYTLDGINISVNVHEIIGQLKRFSSYKIKPKRVDEGLALLFHGPPGTGKTALGNYLGLCLERQTIIRRYSDLQSTYVGQGEKNIRDAFAEAEREEAILIIDEADSMLFGRDRAVRSYEITFTNEFLTQMEVFQGLLICTSNRLNDIDPAALRRFTFKVGFDYLTPTGNLIFYGKLLEPLLKKKVTEADRKSIRDIRLLTPGDFKTVRKRFAYYAEDELNHKIMIKQLQIESTIKSAENKNQRIGF